VKPPRDATDRDPWAAFATRATEAIRDSKLALEVVGATITPEAVVYAGGASRIAAASTIRYVDLGVERPARRRTICRGARRRVAGKPVPHPTTQAVGCYIAIAR